MPRNFFASCPIKCWDCNSSEEGKHLRGCPNATATSVIVPEAKPRPLLPTDAKERKKIPLWTGLVKYFPLGLIEVAKLSYIGNEQHNPGEPLHWAREKSTDQEDTLLRHLFESGTVDTDGVRHSVKVVWRALAKLEIELEAAK